MLPFQKQVSNTDIKNTQLDFDAMSLYLSALWDEKSVYPKIETGFAFKQPLNDIYVEAFNVQSFSQNGNESAIL